MSVQAVRQAYAASFANFLIEKLATENKLNQIERIILFGSVAHGTSENVSDVDIFIEAKSKKIETEVHEILDKFYLSKDAIIFRLRGIDNKINIIVGRLSEWKSLEQSVAASGIMLWGRVELPAASTGKRYALFYWKKVSKNRGAFINMLYGVKIKGKRYLGLVEKLGGRRFGKSSIAVPIQHKDKIIDLIKKYSADAKIIEINF